MLRRRFGVVVACCCLLSTASVFSLSTVAAAATPADGKIAFNVWQNGFVGLYTVNPDGTGLTQLAWKRDAAGGAPSWSPDGSKIAYYWRAPSGAMDIFSINADGSGKTQLTDLHSYSFDPNWSPVGNKIAFISSGQVYSMNTDGTDQTQLTTTLHSEYTMAPLWSPDGSKIVFESQFKIFVVNADGSGLTQVSKGGFNGSPDWSPDGTKIAFSHTSKRGVKSIYTVAPDDTGLTRLTQRSETCWFPEWSPDGTRIVFSGERGGISVINADGSGLQAVPGTLNDRYPDWSPDGTEFVFTHVSPGNWSNSVIGVVSIDGSNHLRLTSHAGSFDAYAAAWQAL